MPYCSFFTCATIELSIYQGLWFKPNSIQIFPVIRYQVAGGENWEYAHLKLFGDRALTQNIYLGCDAFGIIRHSLEQKNNNIVYKIFRFTMFFVYIPTLDYLNLVATRQILFP